MANVKVPPFLEAPQTVVGPTPQTAFPFAFPFWDDADLLVYLDGALLASSGYTVEGLAVQDGDPVEGGYGSGIVTLDSAVSNVTVTIDRQVVGDRETQFSRSAPLGMPALNADLNRVVARQQDIFRAVGSLRSFLDDAISEAGDAIGLIGKVSYTILAATGGAALVGWLQTGTGAVLRTVREKLLDTVHAKDFGVKADGVTDDTLALKAALAAFPGKKIRLPAGTMLLGNVGGLDFAGTRIKGDGRYETIVVPVASMTDGTAIFSNSQAALGTSAYTEVSHIRFRFNGKNVIGVDLSSVNNSIVDQCYFAGSELGSVQTGVGVRFGSPLDQGSYSNNVRDCAFYSLSKGVEYLEDANSNMITGGECIFCVIGVDAAPVGYLDTPRIIGMRFEGGGTGIKEKSEGANYIACRFESNSLADIDFINNGSGDQSIRPRVLGCYTATTVTSLRNLSNAVSPFIDSPDMGRYDVEASTSPKFFHGRQVFATRSTALNPTLPAVDYACFFYDTPMLRNQIPLEWTNAANTSSCIAVLVDSLDRTVVRSFNRATGTDADVVVGGGPAVVPLSNNVTSLGSASLAWGGGYIFGRINRSATVVDEIGSGTPEGVVTGGIGSTFRRTDGGAGTSFYVKESGTGNTGWVGK